MCQRQASSTFESPTSTSNNSSANHHAVKHRPRSRASQDDHGSSRYVCWLVYCCCFASWCSLLIFPDHRQITMESPTFTSEKHDLWVRYLLEIHELQPTDALLQQLEFSNFFCRSPTVVRHNHNCSSSLSFER